MYLPPTPTLQRVLFKIRDAEVQVLGLGWLFTFVNWFAYFKIKSCYALFKIRNTKLQVLGLSRVRMIFMIYSSMSWIFRTRAGFLEPELTQKLPEPSWAELSRAERPLARAKSELSRAELSSVASLVIIIHFEWWNFSLEESFLARNVH